MTDAATQTTGRITRLVDIVFPGDTNHHGTLFGGIGLAHMDRVAFITAARHAPVAFVTASCEWIDFEAPARLGEIVEVTGRIIRVGRRSLAVEVVLMAEAPLTAERRRCGRGVFNMVAVGEGLEASGGVLPPLGPEPEEDGSFSMVALVLPDETSHYGSLHGSHALKSMAKAAFVVATRRCRRAVVMASSQRVDFTSQIQAGEITEITARISATGRSSITVNAELWAENPQQRQRRACGSGSFVMVAVDEGPVPWRSDICLGQPIPSRPAAPSLYQSQASAPPF